MVKLKEISIDLSNGLNFAKEQVGHGTKFINVKDIFNDNLCINLDSLERVNIKENEVSKKKVKTGDLLFVRSSVKYEGVGYTALIGEINEPVVFAGFVIKLSPDLSKVDPFYLCSLLRSPVYRNIIISLGNRGTITNISQASIESIIIPLPTLSKQQEIAKMIKDELLIINGNKRLEEIYKGKIKDCLNRVWGDVL